MTWTKLSDDFSEKLQALQISRSARTLLVEMYVWSNRNNTDGGIPIHMMRVVTDSLDWQVEVKELAEAELLDVLGEGFRVPWEDQMDADEVEKRRAKDRVRQRRTRLHRADDHSECDPKYCRAVTRDSPRDSNVKSHGESRDPGRTTRPKEAGQVVGPTPHDFVDDGGGHDDCETCQLPKRHPVHGRTSK